MKKLYKIFILLTALTFLTTYSSHELNIFPKKENTFLKIRNIKIINNYLIEKNEIKAKLNNIYNKNILFIKRKDIEKPLRSIDFLKKIEVKKKYPNTIIIKIYETKPIAILFKKNEKFILDNSSNLITFNKNLNQSDFPSVFGEGAENDFVNFINKLEDNNFPKSEVKKFYYFQIGRWDVQFSDDQIIKFPSNITGDVIQQSVKLLGAEDFKNYKIIDLRIRGKIIVE